jgi:Peptidase family M1 domain
LLSGISGWNYAKIVHILPAENMSGYKLIISCSIAFYLLAGLAACSAKPVSLTASPILPSVETFPASESGPTPTRTLPPPTATAALPALATIPPTQSPPLPPTQEPVLLPAPLQDRTHYQLEATLDYGGHVLAVDESITYTNTTSDRLSTIVLMVEALRYPGCFQLVSLADGSGRRLTQYRTKDTSLTVSLPQQLAPGEKMQLLLAYTLRLLDTQKLPKLRPYPLGYTSVQTNLGDWYPFIPPYQQGAGWLVHPPAFYGEYLVYDIADFDVAIRFAGGQNNLVIAAGAPAVGDGEWQRFSHPAARSFAWSVSPYYQVVTQTVELAPGKTTLIASYYFSAHAEAGKSLLDTMAKALPLYSQLWGNYPHPMFTGVQADFLDGMEYDGLYFLSTAFYNWHKDTQADFLVALAAHETAHQWFSGLVGSDQALQPWLDEALCTYSERIFYENIDPPALDWWWAYRVDYYEPQGWVDISVYDTPAVAGQYHLYRDPVYLRGALFLEQLRSLVGDEAFFAALQAYVEQYAYHQADAAGFLATLRQHTSTDLKPILMQFLSKSEY